ncbi:hypothetical protein, partial [Pedobacter sp.]|uniref:hypothetical protein n=1 Tax=Pedobacter sp. TaxID=1411316 RepID=UPI002CDF5606
SVISIRPYITNAPAKSLRLPILVTSQPDKGKESINPTGNAKSTAPSPASDNDNFCCIVAIRDAQLEKHNPAIKNMAATAPLVTFGA